MPATIIQPAFVDPRAELGDDVRVGPFSFIGPNVRIGNGTIIENNVTITGHTTIGEGNHIFPNVVIGAPPQDVSYRGSETRVVIGDQNILREAVTINRATEKEEGITELGSNNFLMANCHVAHDCRLGNNIIMANGVLLGGHVRVKDYASLSGGAVVHHYSTLGSYCFVAGVSRVLHDVAPFMLVDGSPARPRCVNVVAMKRNNFSTNVIHSINEVFRLLYRNHVGVETARESLRASDQLTPETIEVLDFLQISHQGKHGRGEDRRRAA